MRKPSFVIKHKLLKYLNRREFVPLSHIAFKLCISSLFDCINICVFVTDRLSFVIILDVYYPDCRRIFCMSAILEGKELLFNWPYPHIVFDRHIDDSHSQYSTSSNLQLLLRHPLHQLHRHRHHRHHRHHHHQQQQLQFLHPKNWNGSTNRNNIILCTFVFCSSWLFHIITKVNNLTTKLNFVVLWHDDDNERNNNNLILFMYSVFRQWWKKNYKL